MFRRVPLSIIRSFSLYTPQWCMSYRFADSLLVSSQHNLYDIYLLRCVQFQTPDDGQRYCPKHVESYSKNKFQKLVFLVSFIIRIFNLPLFYLLDAVHLPRCCLTHTDLLLTNCTMLYIQYTKFLHVQLHILAIFREIKISTMYTAYMAICR